MLTSNECASLLEQIKKLSDDSVSVGDKAYIVSIDKLHTLLTSQYTCDEELLATDSELQKTMLKAEKNINQLRANSEKIKECIVHENEIIWERLDTLNSLIKTTSSATSAELKSIVSWIFALEKSIVLNKKIGGGH